MGKEEKNKEVALVQEHTNLPALPPDIDFSQDMEEFGANYSQEQMTTPFLVLLQALSKAAIRGQPEYVQGAQSGMFMNTVTRDLYDGEKGLNVILSSFKESYIEWVPRSKGGGFVKEYDSADGLKVVTATDEKFKEIIQPGSPLGNPGNELSLTHTRLGAVVNDDLTSWTPVVISLTGTSLKVSRSLNARHKTMEWINPSTGKPGPFGKCPMPLILWSVKSVTRSNDQGTWFTWDFDKKSFLYELPPEKFLGLYRSIRDFSTSAKGSKMMEEAAKASVVVDAKTGEVSDLDDTIPF